MQESPSTVILHAEIGATFYDKPEKASQAVLRAEDSELAQAFPGHRELCSSVEEKIHQGFEATPGC